MDYRQIARFLAAGRAVVGLASLVAPTMALRSVGAASDTGARLITRAFGGRELMLALGALRSLDHDEHSQAWVRAGAGADVIDAAAVVLGARGLGVTRSVAGATVATAAAVAGLRAADRLD